MSCMIDWSLRIRRHDKKPFDMRADLVEALENSTYYEYGINTICLLSDRSEWELGFITHSFNASPNIHLTVQEFCKKHPDFVIQLDCIDEAYVHRRANYSGDKFEVAYGQVIYPEMTFVSY